MDEKVFKFDDASKGIAAQSPNYQKKDFEFPFLTGLLGSVNKLQKEGEEFVVLNAQYLYKVQDNTLFYNTEIAVPNSISLFSQNGKYLVFTDQTNKDKIDVLFYNMESLKFDNSLKREIQIELKNEQVIVKMENDEIVCRTYQSKKMRSVLFEKTKKVFPFTEFVVWITEEWIHNCDEDLLYSICEVIEVPLQLFEPSKQTVDVFNEKKSYEKGYF